MRSIAPVLVGFALCALAVSAAAEPGLRLVVEAPASGTTFGSEMVFVSGRALRLPDVGHGRSMRPFEVVIAIDVSASTRAPTGADIDGDGTIGRMPFSRILPFVPRVLSLASNDPGDSILASEIEAARTLLDQLDPETTRVSVVAFSGDDYSDEADAYTAVPLTTSYTTVASALAKLLERGPAGMTNISMAIDVSTAELADTVLSDEDVPAPNRVVLLMTDGQPTLPVPNTPSENARRALAAASRAADREVRFDTFGIGRTATDDPLVIQQIAERTGGDYTAVEHPRDLVAAFRGIRLAEIDHLRIVNRTTGKPARFTHLGADGSFSGVVELTDGDNELHVEAKSTDGLTMAENIRVRLLPEGQPQALTSRLRARRIRVLESRRAELDERIRQILVREMEAVREEERMRRSLEIRAEREDESEPD